MAGLIEELINVLDEERQMYESLVTTADQKTEVIINGDVPSLQEMTQQEQELAGRLYRLNNKRQELIKDIALVTNMDEKSLTISKLTELLAKEKAVHDKLLNLTDRIKEVVTELKIKNDQNMNLIQQSLDYIDFTFNAIQSKHTVPDHSNYQSEGNVYQNQKTSFFDAKQ